MATPTIRLTSNIFKNCSKQRNLINFRRMSTAENEVIFQTINNVGIIILNRPKVLNTLTLSMIEKLLPTLQEWENQKAFVLVKGTGEKAFCAGGDIRAIAESCHRGEKLEHILVRKEYTVNSLINKYHIPYVALIDGIVMGGGVGLSIHGHYRICTERTLFAMPETAIGLFPDVGSSYILPRLQGKLGLYLGLTGHRLKGPDVLKAGIATHYINSKNINNLEQELLKCTNHDSIQTVLSKICIKDEAEFSLKPHLEKINKCFSGNTIEEIIGLLEKDSSDFAKTTIETLSRMSPTSLKVSLKLFQLGSRMNLHECLQLEYRAAVSCLSKHDYFEGVRALIIDKDKKPKWKPATLQQVTDDIVYDHFLKLPENAELRYKL